MDENKYDLAFQIISEAGDARSKALNAITLIQDGKIEEGEEKI
ncbi:MAG: PTS lactose/cellobiose transporter subunit IIA, partial [Erysipelotrichaceae bacterium]|nr:PTS lactose/cellobiose transporter subunit IIA [Erysipelotrichaceae bacterium]